MANCDHTKLICPAAVERDKLRAALEEIASGLSVRDPFTVANEALGRAVTS